MTENACKRKRNLSSFACADPDYFFERRGLFSVLLCFNKFKSNFPREGGSDPLLDRR